MKSDRDSLYFQMLAKNLRLEEFKDLQIVHVNKATQEALQISSLPLFVSEKGEALISVQKISQYLTDMVSLTPVLLGTSANQQSSVFKWMELSFDFKYYLIIICFSASLNHP